MKEISVDQFIELIESADIEMESDVVETVYFDQDVEIDGPEGPELAQETVGRVWGWVSNTLKADGLEISYNAGWEHPEHKPSEAEATTDDVSDLWTIDKMDFIVVDEGGDELDFHHGGLDDLILEHTDIDNFSDFDLGDDEATDIDIDEDSDMETFTVERDNDTNIRFTGELIASASSSPDQAMGSSYSGSTGRWTNLALYRTKGGKFVCEQIGRTQWQGEHDRHSGTVCDTEQGVIDFFGHGWLAKELYEDAGIEDVTEVE